MCVARYDFDLKDIVIDTARFAGKTHQDVNKLHEITKHMQTNLSNEMRGLAEKLSLQLKVFGVEEHGTENTATSSKNNVFQNLFDGSGTTLDQALFKIDENSRNDMVKMTELFDTMLDFADTEFAQLADELDANMREWKGTMLLKNLELHKKMDNQLKQIKGKIDSSLNIKVKRVLHTIFEEEQEGQGAAVDNVGSKTTMTNADCTGKSSSQWMDGA